MAVNMGVIWASYWVQGRDVIDWGGILQGEFNEHTSFTVRNIFKQLEPFKVVSTYTKQKE
jgi:hypothetical protein